MSILTQYLVADEEERKRLRAMFPEIAKMSHTYQLASNAPELAKMSNSYNLLKNAPEMLKRSHLGQIVSGLKEYGPEIINRKINTLKEYGPMLPSLFGAMGKRL